MHEIETKILEIKPNEIKELLAGLGATEINNTRLIVDWYCPKGANDNNSHPWYLRVRKSTIDNKTEITWKSLEKTIENTRQSKEININTSDFENTKKILLAIGFEHYAHQEKDRVSFLYKNWRFDIDQYPGMPAYLEIEGNSVEHINEAIRLLHLENYESISMGETKLIGNRYKLNWNNMFF